MRATRRSSPRRGPISRGGRRTGAGRTNKTRPSRRKRSPGVAKNTQAQAASKTTKQPQDVTKATKATKAAKTVKPQSPVMDDVKKKEAPSFLNRLSGAINSAINIKPNAEQREALQAIHTMLGPDKLGGKDGVFNHKDVDAITKGLLKDRQGLVKEATGQLRKEGKNFQAGLVEKAFSGRTGLIKRKIQQKVLGEVSGQVKGQLKQGLNEAKVDPKNGGPIDGQDRTVNFNELRDFEAATKVMNDFQAQIRERLGFDVIFPNGISQAAIQHTLDGKFGIPPGGVISR
jgi:hypothetical protein